MARKVIITVAQTGAFHGKDANPNLPITPEEIAQSAYDCYNAGAAIVHIHVRDDEGKPSYDINKYHETIECPAGMNLATLLRLRAAHRAILLPNKKRRVSIMSDLKNKRVISAAIIGSWPTRQDNPNVPLTPAEIAVSIAGEMILARALQRDEGGGAACPMHTQES